MGGLLLGEQIKSFLAGAANFLVHFRRPRLHLLVHPVTARLRIDDANAFADRIENKARLLGNKGTLERKEISRIGKDGAEVLFAEQFDRLIDGGDFHYIAGGAQALNCRGVRRRLIGQNQNFSAFTVQRVGSATFRPSTF